MMLRDGGGGRRMKDEWSGEGGRDMDEAQVRAGLAIAGASAGVRVIN
jgi:hypothetical protein